MHSLSGRVGDNWSNWACTHTIYLMFFRDQSPESVTWCFSILENSLILSQYLFPVLLFFLLLCQIHVTLWELSQSSCIFCSLLFPISFFCTSMWKVSIDISSRLHIISLVVVNLLMNSSKVFFMSVIVFLICRIFLLVSFFFH